MIRTIQSIRGFGVFSEFRWPASLPEFKQFNLIYGWNYSGKTTLSRAFRCFELKQQHSDFADAQVQLRAEDGTVYHSCSADDAPVFRVFNSDFVRENLYFEAGSTRPILVLGVEDIAKQGALEARRVERGELTLSKESNEREREAKQAGIEKALTTYARDLIKIPLSVPNYDKTRLEPHVTACRTNPGDHLLDEEALSQCLSIFRSTDKRPALSTKVVALSSVSELQERAASVLARVVTANNPIPRLKENPTVESWVNQGRSLHAGKAACQFCGRRLPKDLIAHLAGHFSADYENLMAELTALAKVVDAAQKENIQLDHEAALYAELSQQYMAERDCLEVLLKARRSALETLSEALASKCTKAFTRLECPGTDDPALRIASAVEAINATIEEHNTRTTEFDKRRGQALAKLEKHYAASFVRDQEYNEQLRRIEELQAVIVQQSERLGELSTEIGELEQTLSEASKGARRINELLATYFGKDDLRITASADKQFQILRADLVAKNLSEGEKTAIAFAYFITRVQDGRHPLGDTRVVIDDPVSSLDANHLFGTYALIKTQLACCRQLFIATHSFEFYNLMREWLAEDENDIRKPQADWKKWGVFLVRRTSDGRAVLEEIPRELLKFRSEYHYLFSKLYHFDSGDADDFDCLLSLPNVVRRFMEAFGGIMIPLSTGLKNKMERIFPDAVVRERVWKFINHYSHNTTMTRSLIIPDTSECRAVVRACLKAVLEWDAEYFKDMETEVV